MHLTCFAFTWPLLIGVGHWECVGYPLALGCSDDGTRFLILDKEDVVILNKDALQMKILVRVAHEDAVCAVFRINSHDLAICDANGVSLYYFRGPNPADYTTKRIELKELIPKRIFALSNSYCIISNSGEVWSVSFDGAKCDRLTNLKKTISSACINSDRNLLAIGTRAGEIEIFSLSEMKEKQRFDAHADVVRTLSFVTGKKKQLLSGSYDKTIKLWSIENPRKPLSTFRFPSKVLCVCSVSIDTWAVGCLDGSFRIYDNDKLCMECRLFVSDCYTILSTPKKYLTVSGRDKMIYFFMKRR